MTANTAAVYSHHLSLFALPFTTFANCGLRVALQVGTDATALYKQANAPARSGG